MFYPANLKHQDGLLIAWPSDAITDPRVRASHRQVLADIVLAVADRIELVVMTSDEKAREDFLFFLEDFDLRKTRYRILSAPATVTWVRDYGPLVTKKLDGGHDAIDMLYVSRHYPETADVPSKICDPLGLPLVSAPLYLEGGNLLSNGCGLCITTEFLLEKNGERLGHSASNVKDILREYVGAQEVIVLKSLAGEPNSHIDMFATFTAPDTIVIGEYDHDYDPMNAAILDENAQVLKGFKTPFGPLQVYRVPMPERPIGYWGTYTNVIFSNGMLLFPSYGKQHIRTEEAAVEVYRKLLPGWPIVRIDCSGIIRDNGSLRCVTMNIQKLGKPASGGDIPAQDSL